ncbi:hypothetical protein VTJ83DRAFT_3899 [Remersonia thermophila]|uniref:Large ribosomal subunit protein eL14 domain-containing protein n=1 Tax=Remersonia thermophila TaxID=72144 RepID=A0ABR4DFA9_9PEZI
MEPDPPRTWLGRAKPGTGASHSANFGRALPITKTRTKSISISVNGSDTDSLTASNSIKEPRSKMASIDIGATKWRRVEVGRVIRLESGSLAAIVEIIDHKRVLVDGPSSDPKLATPRGIAQLSRSLLTSIVIPKLPRGARTPAVKKAWEAAGVDAKWAETNWAKKQLIQERRASLTDFDRFKVMRLKKQRRFEERKALAKIKASA